jgi:hypothetical protein
LLAMNCSTKNPLGQREVKADEQIDETLKGVGASCWQLTFAPTGAQTKMALSLYRKSNNNAAVPNAPSKRPAAAQMAMIGHKVQWSRRAAGSS